MRIEIPFSAEAREETFFFESVSRRRMQDLERQLSKIPGIQITKKQIGNRTELYGSFATIFQDAFDAAKDKFEEQQ